VPGRSLLEKCRLLTRSNLMSVLLDAFSLLGIRGRRWQARRSKGRWSELYRLAQQPSFCFLRVARDSNRRGVSIRKKRLVARDRWLVKGKGEWSAGMPDARERRFGQAPRGVRLRVVLFTACIPMLSPAAGRHTCRVCRSACTSGCGVAGL
jgi:hypothetical protein